MAVVVVGGLVVFLGLELDVGSSMMQSAQLMAAAVAAALAAVLLMFELLSLVLLWIGREVRQWDVESLAASSCPWF